MPTAMTFTSLEQDLIDYAERGNISTDATVVGQIPSIINNAERRMARELKIQGFINVVQSAMIIGTPAYAKPDRWRETISMSIGTGTGSNTQVFLREMSYEGASTYWPDRSSTGTPKYYADYDYLHYLILPVPASAFPWEILYWQLPPLLDATNTTNWLTEYAPNALLHGALYEFGNFLKNTEFSNTWHAEYDRDMGALAGEDLQKIVDRYYKRATS